MLLLLSADFFQNYLSQKILSGTLSECQIVWIQSRMDLLSVLIWVQTVCKGYQHYDKIAAGKESVKASIAALAECFTLFSMVYALSDSYK